MRSDRWANENDIKAVLSNDESGSMGGPVLYHEKGRNWEYIQESHGIYLGLSGTGKSRRGMLPMVRSLIEARESFIVVDPKGEIYDHTDCYADNASYKRHIIDFRHIFESEHYNPLGAPMELFSSEDPNKRQRALEMIDDLAYTLFPVADRSDPFWNDSARNVFVGTVYALMSLGDPKYVTLASAYQFIARGEESWMMKKAIDLFVGELDHNSISSMLLQGYINTASDTKAGIRSSFLDGLSIFARSEGLISMFSSDDLHINDLDGDTPTAVYIIIPDESPIFDSIAGVICSQLMNHYVRLAQDEYKGKLPRRLNILLEELGNIGKSIPSLPHLMSAGRSRNIRCFLVLQSLSQLDDIYGKSKASIIKSNADLLIAFRTNEIETLTELSKQCGEREVFRENEVAREPLISPSQLGAMETGQALVSISGRVRFISWIPDYTELFDTKDWRPPSRKQEMVSTDVPIFDINEYLKEKINKSGNKNTMGSPLVAPMPEGHHLSANGDIEGILQKVTEEIDGLIEQKEAEKSRENEKGCDVIDRERYIALINTEGKDKEIANILKDFTGSSEKEIRAKMKKLPCSFLIESREKADEVLCKINQIGGFAMFGNVAEDWCS